MQVSKKMALTPKITVRPIDDSDILTIIRWIDKWQRVHWRISPLEVETKLATRPGFLAEDRSGLRGFMLTEPQPAGHLLMIGIGLRDSWNVRPYLKHLLPPIEALMQAKSLTGLMHIGGSDWFVNGLAEHGFSNKAWVVTLERLASPLPPFALPVTEIRPATKSDILAIHNIDCLTFDTMWHKAQSHFSQALNPPHHMLTAILNCRVVGYIWSERYNNHVHITRLVVHPDYQGRQIGVQLLHQLLTEMLALGITRFSTNTLAHNQPALKIYKQFNFDHTQQMPILWRDTARSSLENSTLQYKKARFL